jgi:hypothetical protein
MNIPSDTLPTQWQVILKDGSVLGIWAGGHSEADGYYVFEISAEATPDERADPDLVITTQHPTRREEISFIVAKVPVDLVANIWTRSWDTPATSDDHIPTDWGPRPTGYPGPLDDQP